ncbi:MAG: glycosyltransferase [Paludibacteraceae bacterium]|nr:glycosyltransferase [Paludibacteraceae bacterium]
MLNVSIVLYHTPQHQLNTVLHCLHGSPIVRHIELIDNGLPGRNVGYGAGHNQALRQTLADDVPYHLVVNADISFEPEVLEQMVAYMEAHPEVGQMMPHVIYPDGKTQYVCKLLPTPLDVFGRRFLPDRWMAKRNANYELRASGYDRIMNVPYLSGCFMLLRTSALRKVGLFDERFFMYPEDIDLTRRMHRYYQTLYYPSCTIVHHHEQGSYHNPRLLWIHITNLCRYFNKWGWLFDRERRLFNRATINACLPNP